MKQIRISANGLSPLCQPSNCASPLHVSLHSGFLFGLFLFGLVPSTGILSFTSTLAIATTRALPSKNQGRSSSSIIMANPSKMNMIDRMPVEILGFLSVLEPAMIQSHFLRWLWMMVWHETENSMLISLTQFHT